jgi:hypothetical protein
VDVVRRPGRGGRRRTWRWRLGDGRRGGCRLRWRRGSGNGRRRRHAGARWRGHDLGQGGRGHCLRRGRGSRGRSGLAAALTKAPGGRSAEDSDDEEEGHDRPCEARPARPTPIRLPQVRLSSSAGEVCAPHGRIGRQLVGRVVGRRGMPPAVRGPPPTGRRRAPVPATAGVHPPVGVCITHHCVPQPFSRAGVLTGLPGANATESDGRHSSIRVRGGRLGAGGALRGGLRLRPQPCASGGPGVLGGVWSADAPPLGGSGGTAGTPSGGPLGLSA